MSVSPPWPADSFASPHGAVSCLSVVSPVLSSVWLGSRTELIQKDRISFFHSFVLPFLFFPVFLKPCPEVEAKNERK